MLHSGPAVTKWEKADEVRRMHSISVDLVPVSFIPKSKKSLLIQSTCETFCTLSLRYRFGSGKSCSQLTVEELSSFVRQLYNLPCSLPQAPLLKVGKEVHARISSKLHRFLSDLTATLCNCHIFQNFNLKFYEN